MSKDVPEYCLFFIDFWALCMTKSEWAGWMQAIGAVAAIAGAFFIAWVQVQHARSAAREKDAVTIAGVQRLFQALNHSAKAWLAEQPGEPPSNQFVSRRHTQLLTIAAAVKAIQLELLLNPTAVDCVVYGRWVVSTLATSGNGDRMFGPTANWTRSDIEAVARGAEVVELALEAEYQRIRRGRPRMRASEKGGEIRLPY